MPPSTVARPGIINKYLWMLSAMTFPALAHAQAVVVQPVAGITGSNFLVALVAGLLLAFAFQMVLANLSVAAGLNVAGASIGGGKGDGQPGGGGPGFQGTLRMISAGFGLWATGTASVALFFGSWLGVSLAVTDRPAVGAVLGLSIWALFFIIAMAVEASAISSMIGSIARVAGSVFRSAKGTVSSLFGASPAEQMADTAARITSSVREELFGGKEDFREQLQNYINQLRPSQPTPGQIGDQIARMLSDTEIRAVTSEDGRQTMLQFLEKGGLTREAAQSAMSAIQSTAAKMKQEAETGKDTVSKAGEAAMRMAGLSGKEAQDYREKIEGYLRSTGKPQLNPDAIKRDIEELIRSPRAGAESLRSRVASIDKSTVVTLLAQRKDLSQEDARKIADRVDQVIQSIKSGAEAGAEKAQGVKEATLGKIRDYLNSLHQPELRYEEIAHDLKLLFRDPKAGADALIERFKSMDRETLKALLASRKDLSERDAEYILQRIESARDEYLQKARQMKEEVQRRIEDARKEIVRQAEETARTASVAAWWVVATAVVSGLASMFGGMLGA